MTHSHPKLIDVAAEIKGETEKAFRLFDGAKTEWIPKSQCEDNGGGNAQRRRVFTRSGSGDRVPAGREDSSWR